MDLRLRDLRLQEEREFLESVALPQPGKAIQLGRVGGRIRGTPSKVPYSPRSESGAPVRKRGITASGPLQASLSMSDWLEAGLVPWQNIRIALPANESEIQSGTLMRSSYSLE